MRFRALVLAFSLLALPMAVRADTIDDLVLVGQGHTTTFSLDSLLPITSTVGSSEFESLVNAAATVDGVGGKYINLTIYSIFLNTQPTGDNIISNSLGIFVPGVINNDLVVSNTPLVTDNGFHTGTTFLIPWNYTLSDRSSVPRYILSITPQGLPSPLPEPSTLLLLGTGCLALAFLPGCVSHRGNPSGAGFVYPQP